MSGSGDEPVAMYNGSTPYYYHHDHLYNTVAVLDLWTGDVEERYEYDAYGQSTILEPDFDPDPDQISNYDTFYLFTGRRVDILDTGSLKIQYNRNRYYDYYTGRWTTQDPLGITPNPQKPNRFDLKLQYCDGQNLLQLVPGNPLNTTDPFGLRPIRFREREARGGRYSGVVRYQNQEHMGHAGLLVTGLSDRDVDFGPNLSDPSLIGRVGALVCGDGLCPWDGGGPGRDYYGNIVPVKKTPLLIRRCGRMRYYWWPTTYNAKCCDASPRDIKACIRTVCHEWSVLRRFSICRLGVHCRDFVDEVKWRCCLKDYDE